MTNIKKIIIENFQCHKETVLEPAENGLTVITGPTDHGKSAVVRALKWLFYNRPQGDDFIRHGAGECKVSVELENGLTVMRRRTASLNQYWINNECFEGFGNDVPQEVQQSLGVYTYEIADNVLYLNIAEQLEGPFLGSSITAPTRAKILGKLAGAETIDKAQKQVGTDIYRADQKQKQLESDIKEKKSDIDDYSWVEPLGETLEKAEDKLAELKKNKEKLNNLIEIKSKLNEVNQKYQAITANLEKVMSAEFAVNDVKDIEEKLQTQKDLFDIRFELSSNRQKKEKLNKCLLHLSDVVTALQKLSILIKEQSALDHYENIALESQNLYADKKEIINNLSLVESSDKSIQLINQIELKIRNIEQLDWIHDKLFGILWSKKQIINDYLDKLVTVDDAQSIIDDIEKQNEKYNILLTLGGEIKDKSIYKQNYKEQLENQKSLVEIFKKNYKSKIEELGICPTCGAEYKSHQLEKVI